MWRKDFALLRQTQPSIEGHDFGVGQLGALNRQIHFANFPLAAKENQNITSFLIAVNILQTVDDHLIAIVLCIVRMIVDNFHGETAARDFNHRRVIKMFGKLGDINGR